MKTINACKNIVILITILVVSCGLSNAGEQPNQPSEEYYPVDVNKIPTILNMISAVTQDNYKRIKTWEGRVQSYLDYIYEGETAERIFKSNTNNIGETPRVVLNSIEAVVEFSLDAEKDDIYIHNYSDKPIKYFDLDTGRDLGAKGIAGNIKAIKTQEYYIKTEAKTRRNGVITSRKAIKQNPEESSSCQEWTIFDPRESFSAGRPVWEILQNVLDLVEKNNNLKVDGHGLKVEKYEDGSFVNYRIIIPGKITEDYLLFTTMVFSENKGFNIVLFEVADANDKTFQDVTWDYELKQEIYLPKETTHNNYMGKEGRLSFSKKMIFENSRINLSIPEETFSYKNLDLKDGDEFIDKIENKEYKYEDANLVFIKNLPATPEPNNPP